MLNFSKIAILSLCALCFACAESFAAGKLYWTDQRQGALMRADLDGSSRETFISGMQTPAGIAIDGKQRHIYWSELSSRSIMRSELTGGIPAQPQVETIHSNLKHPSSLAIDPMDRKLYWSDPVADSIERSELDGTGRELIVSAQQGIKSPQGIAIDVAERKLYWADSGTQRIQRSNLDGSNVETVIENSRDPWGVAVDSHSGHIYWTESAKNRVFRAKLDGSQLREVASGPAPKAVLFDDDSGLLFWANTQPASLSSLGSTFVDQGGLSPRSFVIDHGVSRKVLPPKHPNILWKFIFDTRRKAEYTESADR